MKYFSAAFILCFMVIGSGQAQRSELIAAFQVKMSKSTNGLNVPVSISLKDLKSIPSTSSIALVLIDGANKTYFPFQITGTKEKTLWTTLKAETESILSLQLVKQNKVPKESVDNILGTTLKETEMKVADKDGAFIISQGKSDLLSYVHTKVAPPAGVDSAFGRSGFIHPLWTPHGQVLTRIQPPDHRHHYGIWNPWTHVLFEGDTVDFWNLGSKQGTVRFVKLVSKTSGGLFSEIKMLLDHVVLKKDGTEKIALNEQQTIRVYQPNRDYYIMDFTSELTCASASPFHIVAYRYAGFGWRATEFWDKNNSEMLTSEGKTRDSTDGTKARWCIVYGALPGNDEGGAVMLSYPGNYNHPEPLRIWDKKANSGRGDVFANFAPTKDKDWILEPGKTYTLKYRLVVFNGKFDAAKAESAWQYFAKEPEVRMVK